MPGSRRSRPFCEDEVVSLEEYRLINLVRERVKWVRATKARLIPLAEVLEKAGITPEELERAGDVDIEAE